MNTSGWVVMILSVGFVTVLTFWSVWRVLFGVPNKVHTSIDIEPKDTEE